MDTCYFRILRVIRHTSNITFIFNRNAVVVCFVVAGISMNVQPMYFGESAPKHLRGAISLSSAVFTAFGVVLGQVVGLRYGQRATALISTFKTTILCTGD